MFDGETGGIDHGGSVRERAEWGYTMFFLLRVAFWLSLAILFIPADPQIAAEKEAGHEVSTLQAIGAANSTWEDVKGFCGRNPTACDVGRVALDTFTAKARTGARWVYEQLDGPQADRTAPTMTGSTGGATRPSGLRPTLGWDAPLPPRAPIG
jgi:hypothetical protein